MARGKNSGKASEKQWEEHFDRKGKVAFYHRLVDASEIRGRTGVVGRSVRKSPADYILTTRGENVYAEVKSTENKTSFPFNMISQASTAKQIQTAGGPYVVYVHALEHDQWYRIPYNVIEACKAAGRASLKWEEIETLKWDVNA